MSKATPASNLPSLGSVTSWVGRDASGTMGVFTPYCCLTVKVLASNVDMNDITEPGLYAVSGNNPNFPISTMTAGLLLFVFSHSPGYIQQEVHAIRNSTPTIFCRRKEGTAAQWGEWWKIPFVKVS